MHTARPTMRATSLCVFFAGALAIVASPVSGWAGTGGGGGAGGAGAGGGAGGAVAVGAGRGQGARSTTECDGGFTAEDGGVPICPSTTPDFFSCAARPGGSGAGAGLLLLGATAVVARRRRRSARRVISPQ